jgi:hypothetical protein
VPAGLEPWGRTHRCPAHSKKTAVAMVAILITLIVIGYTYSAPVVADVVKGGLKESKLMSMALKGAKCDEGLPQPLKKVVNGSSVTYAYKYVWCGMGRGGEGSNSRGGG